MIPLPIFPVDSASNCSSQAPKSEIPGDVTIVTLSCPAFAAVPRMMPSTAPGFSATATLAPQAFAISAALARNLFVSSPITAAGTMPKFDRGTSEEDVQEAIRLGHLLHFRAGIGDSDEVASYFRHSDRLLRAFEEVLFEDVGFERAAGLARDDKKRFRNIDLMFERLHLRGIGGIEHVQVGEMGGPAEGHAQNFRTKTRPAHAEEKYVLEPAGLDFFCDLLQLVVLGNLLIQNIEPAQPVGFIAAGPQLCIALPQALHLGA